MDERKRDERWRGEAFLRPERHEAMPRAHGEEMLRGIEG